MANNYANRINLNLKSRLNYNKNNNEIFNNLVFNKKNADIWGGGISPYYKKEVADAKMNTVVTPEGNIYFIDDDSKLNVKYTNGETTKISEEILYKAKLNINSNKICKFASEIDNISVFYNKSTNKFEINAAGGIYREVDTSILKKPFKENCCCSCFYFVENNQKTDLLLIVATPFDHGGNLAMQLDFIDIQNETPVSLTSNYCEYLNSPSIFNTNQWAMVAGLIPTMDNQNADIGITLVKQMGGISSSQSIGQTLVAIGTTSTSFSVYEPDGEYSNDDYIVNSVNLGTYAQSVLFFTYDTLNSYKCFGKTITQDINALWLSICLIDHVNSSTTYLKNKLFGTLINCVYSGWGYFYVKYYYGAYETGMANTDHLINLSNAFYTPYSYEYYGKWWKNTGTDKPHIPLYFFSQTDAQQSTKNYNRYALLSETETGEIYPNYQRLIKMNTSRFKISVYGKTIENIVIDDTSKLVENYSIEDIGSVFTDGNKIYFDDVKEIDFIKISEDTENNLILLDNGDLIIKGCINSFNVISTKNLHQFLYSSYFSNNFQFCGSSAAVSTDNVKYHGVALANTESVYLQPNSYVAMAENSEFENTDNIYVGTQYAPVKTISPLVVFNFYVENFFIPGKKSSMPLGIYFSYISFITDLYPIYRNTYIIENDNTISYLHDTKFEDFRYSIGDDIIENPSLTSILKFSYTNINMAIENEKSFVLMPHNNYFLMAYYSLNFYENIENIFVINSMTYAISKNRIARLYLNNYQLSGIEYIVDVTGFKFIGALYDRAIFYSPYNKKLYYFTGSANFVEILDANRIEEVLNCFYLNFDNSLIMGTREKEGNNIYIIKQDNEIKLPLLDDDEILIDCFSDYKNENNLIFNTSKRLIYLRYDEKQDFEKIPIDIDTCYLGQGIENQTIYDCIYLRLFSENKESGIFEIESETITNIQMQSNKRIVHIKSSDWEENGSIIIRYQPKFQNATAMKFNIKSDFMIYSIIAESSDAQTATINYKFSI